MLDELLPDREANDAIFRLAVSVLQQLRSGSIWMPLTYFQLWLVRLVGFLPELTECAACGEALNGSRAYLSRAGRRPDVPAAQAAGVVGAVSRSRGCWRRRCFVLRWRTLVVTKPWRQARVRRSAAFAGADHGAPPREEAGDRQHAGEVVDRLVFGAARCAWRRQLNGRGFRPENSRSTDDLPLASSQNPLTFQELILRLQNFWAATWLRSAATV